MFPLAVIGPHPDLFAKTKMISVRPVGRIFTVGETETTLAPDGALQAIRTAREKFTADKPLGFDLDNEVARARLKMKDATRRKE